MDSAALGLEKLHAPNRWALVGAVTLMVTATITLGLVSWHLRSDSPPVMRQAR